jgi:hypothetical protein
MSVSMTGTTLPLFHPSPGTIATTYAVPIGMRISHEHDGMCAGIRLFNQGLDALIPLGD